MIHEEICTYEVAKLAKEKRFPLQKVVKQDGRAFFYDLPQSHPDWANCDAWYLPTQSLLQRWLRDNHKADVWVETAATMATKNQRCYYWHIAYDSDGSCIYVLDSMLSYSTYEKALEEGLKEALIEFV